MKKVVLNSLLIAALALMAASFTSCKSKRNDDVKLLERMISEDAEQHFEYDNQNRIVKTTNYRYGKLSFTRTITYGKNNVTVSFEHFDEHIEAEEADCLTSYVIDGNTITFTSCSGYPSTITINKEGYIIKEEYRRNDGSTYEVYTYDYRHGKLTSITHIPPADSQYEGGSIVTELIYDDYKSPFYNNKTPVWLLQHIFGSNGLKNNVAILRTNIVDFFYEYEFVNNGPPTMQKISYSHGGITEYGTTTRFIYRSSNEKGITDAGLNRDPNADIYGTVEYNSSDDDYDDDMITETHTVHFKNEEITMTVFRSPNYDGYLDVDSLTFQYDGVKQTLRFQGTEEITSYSPGYGYYLAAGDYNFDGYMDIIIESETGGDNFYYDIYLYNPEKKRFFHHKELSDMTGIQADEETRTIRMYSVGDVEGQTYSMYKYSWMGDELELFYKEDRHFDFDIEKYILVVQSLENLEWVILKTDTISR